MTYLLYIDYQNFTRIRIEKGMPQLLILVQQRNCLEIWIPFCLQSKDDNNHTVSRRMACKLMKVTFWTDEIFENKKEN